MVDSTIIVPSLTTTDISNGTATTTNATTIKTNVIGGYTATVSGNVVTVRAPIGSVYNGKTLTVLDGTSQTLVPAVPAVADVRPTALIRFSGTTANTNPGSVINADLSGTASVKVGSAILQSSAISIGRNKTASQTASAVASAIGTGGTIKAYVGGWH